MNRAQAQNPFIRLKNEAAALAGARPLIERASGATNANTAPIIGEPLTTKAAGGMMTYTALTEMDATNSMEAMTE